MASAMKESGTEEEILASGTASEEDNQAEERVLTQTTPVFQPFAMERPAPTPLPSQVKPFEMRTARLQLPSADAAATAPAVARNRWYLSPQDQLVADSDSALCREVEKKKKKADEKAQKAAAKKAEKEDLQALQDNYEAQIHKVRRLIWD